ncbi:MAG: ABC transporter permease [Pyrinomonadaceae bacterium]|nr:ABC transporter permease [Pyrinomonadaceae bacterium]
MNPILKFISELQDISVLVWHSFIRLFSRPRYVGEIIRQMDLIGVGSLPIVLLTGFFTGAVLVLQTYPTLEFYSIQNESGRSVATSLIRELGPVLAALMVSGRIGSAIAAELGSMVVSQQIDAMRALGTDPVRKLVTPRIVALVFMLPLLTVAADILGLIGGGVVANFLFNQEVQVFVESVRNGISTRDILGGVIKPIFFGLVIGSVACHKGLSTTGGTVGVGRSVTNSVVIASIWVIIFDFFISKALQYFLDIGRI